jgi:hypothetical protein
MRVILLSGTEACSPQLVLAIDPKLVTPIETFRRTAQNKILCPENAANSFDC